MHTRFEIGAPPFRFFIVPGAGETPAFSIGMVWDHWIVDSESIRQLMRRFLARVTGTKVEPMRRGTPPPPVSLFAGVRMAIENRRRHRHALRPPLADPQDFTTGVHHRVIRGHFALGLGQAARALDVTVNDLFLAAMAQVLGPWAIGIGATQGSRTLMGFGVAADTRRSFPNVGEADLGFWLSYFSIVLDPKTVTGSLGEVAKRVALETKHIKATGRPAALEAGFRALGLAWSFFRKPWQRALLVHRGAPCVAGLSNVKLSGSWASSAPGLLDYWRFSPAGPLAPLIFSPTTLDDRFSLAVTWRETAFPQSTVIAWTEDFLNRLRSVSQP